MNIVKITQNTNIFGARSRYTAPKFQVTLRSREKLAITLLCLKIHFMIFKFMLDFCGGYRNSKTYQNVQFCCDLLGADLRTPLKIQFQIFWKTQEKYF